MDVQLQVLIFVMFWCAVIVFLVVYKVLVVLYVLPVCVVGASCNKIDRRGCRMLK